AFNTSSIDEYMKGRDELKAMNFCFNPASDTGTTAPLLFQRKAITVQTMVGKDEKAGLYTFLITRKEIPARAGIQYAEDLLRFDSHEYLVSCYGEINVKKDVYVFSANESKKCSVLFPNTDAQAVFIWEDEANYH